MVYSRRVRIFKYKSFSRFAKRERIDDETLRDIVADFEKGEWDADLGGGVYKQRIARPGEGKSGGYRTIVYFRQNERTFFVYGFPKSERDNIRNNELDFFKEDAADDFSMSDDRIADLVKKGTFIEIIQQEAEL